jgi:hypothetical protein
MRETEYVVIAPGTVNVLERVSGELTKPLGAAVVERPSGGGI